MGTPADDEAIARLLAAENPEQYYNPYAQHQEQYAQEEEVEEEEEEGDDSDDPDYGSGRRPGKKAKKGKKKKGGDVAVAGMAAAPALPMAFDPAAAFAMAAAQAAAAAAVAAVPAGGEAGGEAAVEAAAPVLPTVDSGAQSAPEAESAAGPGAAALPAALPGMPPGMPALTPEQMMLMQQQAMMAAMMAQAMPGLPPGVDPSVLMAMGLPGMGMGMPGLGLGGGAPKAAPKAARSAGGGAGSGGDDEFTATGRRKRKDTGKQRQQSRSWTDDEERLFLEALSLYGRDWKRCADHVGSRDHRAFTSHAQKHFIKLLLRGEEVPPRVAETGRGYTLSGKPLDPNSAAARAYGLKPDLFARIAGTGKLLVGVHVSTLDMSDGPPPQIQRAPRGGGKSPAGFGGGGGGGGGGGRGRGGKRKGGQGSDAYDTEEEDEASFLASVMAGEGGLVRHASAAAAAEPQAELTEYARNRPRRQVGRRMQMGETSESTELTHLADFVGPPGSGAQAQPFAVTVDTQALLVMDFHAHLSTCEVIGLLGGTFDAERRVLEIREAYPCRRADGQASGTAVELCAESQFEVSCLMQERGQVPVGWYHSHPVFEPRPSQKDNENQRNYQALCRQEGSGLEPWVGAIVGPYDQGLESASSRIQLWVVRSHHGQLRPFSVRATTSGAGTLPNDNTEQAVAMALDQLVGDPGRVDLAEQWRVYSRVRLGAPEGPPLTKMQKLRDSLAAHLPAQQQPAACAAFLDRLQAQIAARWRVALPPPAPFVPPPAAAASAALPQAALPVEAPAEAVKVEDAAAQQQAAMAAAAQAQAAMAAAAAAALPFPAAALPMMGLAPPAEEEPKAEPEEVRQQQAAPAGEAAPAPVDGYTAMPATY